MTQNKHKSQASLFSAGYEPVIFHSHAASALRLRPHDHPYWHKDSYLIEIKFASLILLKSQVTLLIKNST